jgi:ribosomal protein S27E
MRVIPQTRWQIQRTSPSLRCVNCGPGHIQCIYSSANSDFNIHLNVSALLYEISRQFNVCYTANFEPNTAHILPFALCELWSQLYTKYLQLRIFWLQYSTVGICAAIVDITWIQCALYRKLDAKYSAHRPVYAVWNVVPDIYKVFTAPHIYASIFSCRYLRCNYIYHDNSMRVILQTWCQIQRISSGLRYVNCGPGHIQSVYSSAFSDFNIHLNVSALLLEKSRQFNACYTANFEPNTAHILPFTLCELWCRLYKKYLQLRIFGLQYSAVGICAASVDITWILCALYRKLDGKFSAHPPAYAVWTVVLAIYNAFTAPHIQTSIFIWTYLPCYWRYLYNSKRVILQTLSQIQRIPSRLRYVNCGPGHIQCIYSTAYSDFTIQL